MMKTPNEPKLEYGRRFDAIWTRPFSVVFFFVDFKKYYYRSHKTAVGVKETPEDERRLHSRRRVAGAREPRIIVALHAAPAGCFQISNFARVAPACLNLVFENPGRVSIVFYRHVGVAMIAPNTPHDHGRWLDKAGKN